MSNVLDILQKQADIRDWREDVKIDLGDALFRAFVPIREAIDDLIAHNTEYLYQVEGSGKDRIREFPDDSGRPSYRLPFADRSITALWIEIRAKLSGDEENPVSFIVDFAHAPYGVQRLQGDAPQQKVFNNPYEALDLFIALASVMINEADIIRQAEATERKATYSTESETE